MLHTTVQLVPITSFTTWLQQGNQQQTYLRKFKNYHRGKTVCAQLHRTFYDKRIPGVGKNYAAQQISPISQILQRKS
jgi:hypothetical protein